MSSRESRSETAHISPVSTTLTTSITEQLHSAEKIRMLDTGRILERLRSAWQLRSLLSGIQSNTTLGSVEKRLLDINESSNLSIMR